VLACSPPQGNDCTFDWGQTLGGSFAGNLAHPLEQGSSLHVDLKVNKFISWKFSCPACGENCTTTVPVVNEPVNVAMPPCPIPAGSIEQGIESILPATSPTGGVKVTAVGSVGVTDANGGPVLTMNIDVLVQ